MKHHEAVDPCAFSHSTLPVARIAQNGTRVARGAGKHVESENGLATRVVSGWLRA